MLQGNTPPRPLGWTEPRATALLVLADGTVLEGFGIGAVGEATGEVCFNTAMTGYQEILTDPSYAGQIITFTFPHIGNVGTNEEDIETRQRRRRPPACAASSSHAAITEPSNWRATRASRRLAEGPRHRRHRRRRHPGADRAHPRQGHAERRHRPRPGRHLRHRGPEGAGRRPALHGRPRPRAARHQRPALRLGRDAPGSWATATASSDSGAHHVVAIDYGVKRNILRLLAEAGCEVTVVPATATAEDVLALEARRRLPLERPRRPGRDRRICRAGDPASCSTSKVPTFGICLGHQMLGLAVGGQTIRCTRAITAPTIRSRT